MRQKYKAIIFAGLPPPVGGITSIVAMLHQALHARSDVQFIAPSKKEDGFLSRLTRPIANVAKVMRAASLVEKGSGVLYFSSAGSSFYEKVLWALLVLFMGRRPILVMVDGNFPEFWSRASATVRWIARAVIQHPRVTLGVQSESWGTYYQSIFPGVLSKIVGATAAPEFFEAAVSARQDSAHHTILYVGWIISQKGILDLLDAFGSLLKTHPNVRLCLVGPLFDQLDYWGGAIRARGVNGSVDLMGPVYDRNTLIREFQAASIFVLPSHFEGFPVALLEALTMGLACVGTSVGGIPDILDHGEAGILVPPRAPLALASALAALLDDPVLMNTLAVRAAERARSVYSHQACIKSYMNLMGVQ